MSPLSFHLLLAGLRVRVPEIASPSAAIGGGTDNVTEADLLIIDL